MIEFDLNSFLIRRPEFSVYETDMLREVIAYLRDRLPLVAIQEMMPNRPTDGDIKILRDDTEFQKYVKSYNLTRRRSQLGELAKEAAPCMHRLKRKLADPLIDNKTYVAVEGIISRMSMKSIELEQNEIVIAEIEERLEQTKDAVNEQNNIKTIAESSGSSLPTVEKVSQPTIIDSTLQR